MTMMSKKIFRSIIAVAMIVLLASLFITNSFLYNYFNQSQVNRLKEELSLASTGVEQSGISYFENFHSTAFRFTFIASDGSVLYDSEAKSEHMENHLDREEISEAVKTGTGSSARYSSTLTERTFYEAVRLQNGDILRISTTQLTIGALIIRMLPTICIIIICSIIIAVILSRQMAKSIVKPLELLDLDNPDNNDTYEELTPVLSRLNKQHRQILQQMQTLRQKSDEFRQITSSMQEGLILLDNSGFVLSINNAAKTLFSADDSVKGQDFLIVDRSPSMSRGIKKALSGTHNEFREQRNGNEYQFLISPIKSDGNIIGVVILCIDVTETAFAERNRKEFTANVSHELKTPLQAIMGSAELLENGLVKPEDTGIFIGNIKTEAARLVELINDIIRLSQLDEEHQLPTEDVDLLEVTQEVIQILTPAASKNNIMLSVNAKHCTMKGVRRYLYEIIYNLCDNAIRYNKTDGTVAIELTQEYNKTILKVSDTGIGIPAEHQNRIFERFYRVDKSHSKETGGTGLGLSIVKHAVSCHNGTIKLDSTVDVGTTITVTFENN